MKRRGNGEGTYRKLANGKIVASLYISKDNRPTQTFDTQKEAQVWMTGVKNAANKGKYINPSKKPLGIYWDKWIKVDKAKQVSAVTRESYAYSRARLPNKLFETAISDITRQDIQEALNGITGKRRTVEMTRTALNMCFEQAVEDKLIIENPVKKTTLPAAERRKKKAYPHDVETEFIKYCMSSPRVTAKGTQNEMDLSAQPYKDALLTILRTGIRRGEACALIWSDWNTNDNKLFIRGTKNDASVADVPLAPEVVEILKRRHAAHPKSIYIFEQTNGKPLRGDNIYRHVHNKFGRSVHGLRHTLGRDAAEAGINPKITQSILRHANIATTLDIYTEITDDDKAAAIIKIASQCNSDVTALVIRSN